MVGAMLLVILAVVGALKTGVIGLVQDIKVGRHSSPVVFWLIISISVAVLVMSAVDLVRMQAH
jgi:hypothetical protein